MQRAHPAREIGLLPVHCRLGRLSLLGASRAHGEDLERSPTRFHSLDGEAWKHEQWPLIGFPPGFLARPREEAAYARSDLLERRRVLMEQWAEFPAVGNRNA